MNYPEDILFGSLGSWKEGEEILNITEMHLLRVNVFSYSNIGYFRSPSYLPKHRVRSNSASTFKVIFSHT